MDEESLTIVYSTRSDNPEFSTHLRETCGMEGVEILEYINAGKYALTEIYNLGLREAKNGIVVFTHDDVIFEHMSNWGSTLIKHFRDSDFGILGKAGTISIAESGTWWEHKNQMVGIVRHQGINPKTGQLDIWENVYSGDFGNAIVETILVDGVFFAVHKERIKKTFDEAIKGFHFYDVDFGLANHFEKVRVGVIFDIQITHKSIGVTNKEWEYNRNIFLHKWRARLPYQLCPSIVYDDLKVECREEPEVALILNAQHGSASLIRCIQSILTKTAYHNYKLFIAFSGPAHNMQSIKDSSVPKGDIEFLIYPVESLAKIRNDVVKNHINPSTELLLFCHDDITLLNDALSRCVQVYLEHRHEIGTIGIRLHLDNNSIQHAGIQLTMNTMNQVSISHRGYGSFYQYNPGVQYDIFSNTGAFLMVSRKTFLMLKGFSENYLTALEDIDFNVRTLLEGKVNCFIGNAVAYHHELETKNIGSGMLSNQATDLRYLMQYIYANIHDARIAKHLRYVAA